jgi:hypothetical protein
MRRIRWRAIIGGTVVVIVVVAVAGELWLRRGQEFDRQAAYHAQLRDTAVRAELIYLASAKNVDGGRDEAATEEVTRLRDHAARFTARGAHHSKLESKYRFAASYPLLPVAADPSEP